MKYSDLRFAFVQLVYGDHNRSRAVRRALGKCIEDLGEDEIGLNVGAGTTTLDPRMRNLDIFPGEHIDYVGKAEEIPTEDGIFGLVVSQECLEHVADPFKAAEEIYRVLRKDGKLFIQLPFIIGYHPGPTDFWRFTKEGITELVERVGFKVQEIGITVGPSSGLYRIAVEYFAVLFSLPLSSLYVPFKALFAVLFYPMKWLDPLMNRSNQVDRIPGGYFVVAVKTADHSAEDSDKR